MIVYGTIESLNIDYRIILKTSTWHRDSHGLFDYESKNITPNYIRCNYSSIFLPFKNNLALLYRVDNNVIFEELKTMDKSSTAISTVLQKDSNLDIYLNTFRQLLDIP